jgi:uncharacterized protein (TIGR02266 family)
LSDENRRHTRIDSRLRCWCEGENVTFYARVGNLSEGGLFLRTSTPLARGAQARVRLVVDELASVEAVARVAWARDEGQGGHPGMGLQFEQIGESERERLRQLIDREKGLRLQTA